MITKPHHCALALAIPLDRDDFLVELNSGINKDFAKSLARQHPALREDILWEEVYMPIVNTVKSVARAVEAKGVTVVNKASLSKVQELFQQFPVVTLVAHWRSSKFYPSDFIASADLIEVLKQPSTCLTQKLTSVLPNNWILHIETLKDDSGDPHICSKTLAQEFNKILESCKLYTDPALNQMPQIAPYDDNYHMYLNRQIIDGALAGIISPGNRIEFFDQFHSIEEVKAAIPEDYDGLLDFTVCNSVLIGNAIKRRRQCIVLVNEKPTSLDIRMVVYKGMIELLTRSDVSYMEAAAAIRREILQEGKRKKGKRNFPFL
jgi:hypothetical protein